MPEEDVVRNESINVGQEPDTIEFVINGVSYLKVTPVGFFVNGNPVDVGDQQAHDLQVYQALKNWVSATQGE